MEGIVFNIQRYSIDDGPGVRTAVFLKGCPLKCLWCSNPESQNPQPELSYRYTAGKHCGTCVNVCPNKAITLDEEGIHIDRSLCKVCGACVRACAAQALRISGQVMTVDEVMKVVRKDKDYYEASGGGVTCSGGEILCQPILSRSCSAAAGRKASIRTPTRPASACRSAGKDSAVQRSGLLRPQAHGSGRA
jgi:pyruvate formate lyase activating enzyme